MTVDILQGDCLAVLDTLPSASVHTCITSPPYFGLRDYGVDGQIGLEDTPDAFVGRLVEVFREVRRALRDDGTLWLNLGDSYARSPAKGQHKPGDSGKQAYLYDTGGGRASVTSATGLADKQLIGIPWRVAFALQADGWYLRQDIIWHKPNPMPESVKDRCTKAHEYIFMLSKGPRYYFGSEAMQEPATNRAPGNKRPTKGGRNYEAGAKEHRTAAGLHNIEARETRNRRSVWTVTTKPFKGAHFATFPPDLIEPCVLAGAPVGGTVLDPFSGSGTTGLVARNNGRKCIGIELNPAYVEIAKARLAEGVFG